MDYIHGFTEIEQNRLVEQGKFLAKYMFPRVDLNNCSTVLEIGCGVGAEIILLAEKFPETTFHGVDISADQLQKAEHLLAPLLKKGKVQLTQGDATNLPYADNSFDSVVIFWLLEHVSNPLEIVKEAHRVVKKGGTFYCTEVFNHSMYLYPNSSELQHYWKVYNEHQRALGGDGDIGARLGSLLYQAGFQELAFYDIPVAMDARMENVDDRQALIYYWRNLLSSATEVLIEQQKVSPNMRTVLATTFEQHIHNKDAIFYYCAKQAIGRK